MADASNVHSDGQSAIIESLSPAQPLTGSEQDLITSLSKRGRHVAGLSLSRDPANGSLFVKNFVGPDGSAARGDSSQAIELDALAAEGLRAREQGRYDVALPSLRLVLRLKLRFFGWEDPETVESMNDLGETLHEHGGLADARRLFEVMHAICMRRVGASHAYTLCAANNLAAILFDQGDLSSSCSLQQEVLDTLQKKLGVEDPEALAAANNLANMQLARGDPDSAYALMLSVYETLKRLLGPKDARVLVSANSLAKTQQARGDLANARLLLESTLAVQQDAVGAEHISTLTTANNLAEVLRAQGDFASSRKLHRFVYDVRRRVLGVDHMDTLASANNLGLVALGMGQYAEARDLLQNVYDVDHDRLGPDHPDTLTAALNLGEALRALGDLSRALALQKMVHRARSRQLGDEHPDTLLAANNRAGTLHMSGNLAEALALHAQSNSALQRVLGPTHVRTVGSADNLASLHLEAGSASRSAAICQAVAEALANAPLVDSEALATFARLPMLRSPHLGWPASGLADMMRSLPELSARVLRQLRSMPLDAGSPLFQSLLLLHDRWCVLVHHHAPRDEHPRLLLAAIGALHGTNAWVELRAEAWQDDSQPKSPAAQQYLAREQELQRVSHEIHEVMQQRDALRERGAPVGASRPLLDRLEDLSREDKNRYQAFRDAESQLAAEDPTFAAQVRANEGIDYQSLIDSLHGDDVWLVPMPQEDLQLADDPSQWSEQVGSRSSNLYVVRRGHDPQVVRISQLCCLVAASRRYRSSLQGTSRGLLRDLASTLPPDQSRQTRLSAEEDEPTGSREFGAFELVRFLAAEGFWKPLLPMLTGVRKVHLVTGPGQHDAMVECGLPAEIAHLHIQRYCGLPAYRRRMMLGLEARRLPEPAWICDPALETDNPIPFTALDSLLFRRKGRGQSQDVQALLALGPSSPLLLVSSHGLSSGSRNNPSGSILIDGQRISASGLARRRPGTHEQHQRPISFLIALSCFGGVVGASSQGDAHGLIAALQLRGLSWAIACVAPVADFYTPLFSSILHHQLDRHGMDPAEALVQTKRLVQHGPWDEELRSDALEPLRQGYRHLMHEILDAALPGSTEAPPETDRRSLRLLRGVLGWPIQGKLQRTLAATLAGAAERGVDEWTALRLAQTQICDSLQQEARRSALVDDALDTLFSGPMAWTADHQEGSPSKSCIAALQSLCAVTVFFGRN